MGGRGSGNWYRYDSKNTVDGLKSLDINWLNRHGYLHCGGWSTISWKCRGKPSGSITLKAGTDRITLEYKHRSGSDDWESVTETVYLTWTPCNYGGSRPWFICPGVKAGRVCGRRVGKLYSAGKYFLCRSCYDLVYESQREDLSFRLLRKSQDIKVRLGGNPSSAAPFPDKPKGMHWDTYLRLYRRCQAAEIGSWRAISKRLKLLGLPDTDGPGV